MNGELIYARSLSSSRIPDKNGNTWQYHPRSDNHGKIACWCVLFDLMLSCSLLRDHIKTGKIGFGINHKMCDYKSNRKKNLDLVICTPGDSFKRVSFYSLYQKYNIALTSSELKDLNSLPDFLSCPVSTSLLAVEAKACMTEHGKAQPRLYDELSSSYQIINGDTNSTIAAGYVTINQSEYFLSPTRNPHNLSNHPIEINEHNQPEATKGVYEKVKQLRRRSSPNESGFDAIGVTLLRIRNDGGPISVDATFDDGQPVESMMTYRAFVERLSTIYSIRFFSL